MDNVDNKILENLMDNFSPVELAEIYAFLQPGYGKHNGCTAMMKLIEKTFTKFAGGISGLNKAMDEAGV